MPRSRGIGLIRLLTTVIGIVCVHNICPRACCEALWHVRLVLFQSSFSKRKTNVTQKQYIHKKIITHGCGLQPYCGSLPAHPCRILDESNHCWRAEAIVRMRRVSFRGYLETRTM